MYVCRMYLFMATRMLMGAGRQLRGRRLAHPE